MLSNLVRIGDFNPVLETITICVNKSEGRRNTSNLEVCFISLKFGLNKDVDKYSLLQVHL